MLLFVNTHQLRLHQKCEVIIGIFDQAPIIHQAANKGKGRCSSVTCSWQICRMWLIIFFGLTLEEQRECGGEGSNFAHIRLNNSSNNKLPAEMWAQNGMRGRSNAPNWPRASHFLAIMVWEKCSFWQEKITLLTQRFCQNMFCTCATTSRLECLHYLIVPYTEPFSAVWDWRGKR